MNYYPKIPPKKFGGYKEDGDNQVSKTIKDIKDIMEEFGIKDNEDDKEKRHNMIRKYLKNSNLSHSTIQEVRENFNIDTEDRYALLEKLKEFKTGKKIKGGEKVKPKSRVNRKQLKNKKSK